VAGDALDSAAQLDSPPGSNRLDSWKEIAAYLKRDVTTVRRWEKREGLPVHRHLHERRDSVYAYSEEIDRWWEGRRNGLYDIGADGAVALNGVNGAETNSAIAERLPASRAWLPWTLSTTFFITTLVLAGLLLIRRPSTLTGIDNEFTFPIYPPENTGFRSVSLSPDGRQLAFTAMPTSSSGIKPLLWIQQLDSRAARPLPETEDATFPFWSPTSDRLGFFAEGKLWTIDIAGGSPRPVAVAPNGHGGTWNPEGIIVFAPLREGGLSRVAARGGAATPITSVATPHERGHLWPEFLPDGKHFLFLADSTSPEPEHHYLFVGTLDASPPRRLFSLASHAMYRDGHLLFVRDRQLIAQRFDLSQLAVTGDAVPIADTVQQGADHNTEVTLSANGVLMYLRMQSPSSRVVWRDRVHTRSTLVNTPAEYYDPTLSPDESRVAIGLFDPKLSKRFGYMAGVRSDIWILDRSTGAASQFTFDPGIDWGPVWSPDGRRVVFSSNRRDGNLELYLKDATGDRPEELLLAAKGTHPVAQSWSPDGKFLLYSAYDSKTRMDLWLLPMSGDRTPIPLVRTDFRDTQGRISPNGEWFAYSSYESGRSEIYVQHFPTPSVKWQISTTGGGDPRWSSDGKELFYIGDDRRLMAVPVKTGARFQHGSAVPLFDSAVAPEWYGARNLYDVSRDGGFLFMSPVEDDRSLPFTIVLNWRAGVGR
jgi:eukaryotic-like serine/threonine-protein kinase